MRISDWSSDLCSSDLAERQQAGDLVARPEGDGEAIAQQQEVKAQQGEAADQPEFLGQHGKDEVGLFLGQEVELALGALHEALAGERPGTEADHRSEEHTSELQSLMRISYAVFCLQKKNTNI